MSQQFPKTLICSLVLLAAAHVSGLSQVVDLVRTSDLGVSPWVLLTVIASLYCCIVALLVFVARGADWARLVYTLFGVLGLLVAVPHLAELSAPSLTALAAKALGLLLLFVPATNPWFRPQQA